MHSDKTISRYNFLSLSKNRSFLIAHLQNHYMHHSLISPYLKMSHYFTIIIETYLFNCLLLILDYEWFSLHDFIFLLNRNLEVFCFLTYLWCKSNLRKMSFDFYGLVIGKHLLSRMIFFSSAYHCIQIFFLSSN